MNRSLGKKIEGAENITNFVLGGKAWFALKSLKTGAIYQFRVNAAKGKRKTAAWWVEVLGPNTDDMTTPYQYIGGLYKRGQRAPVFYKTKDKVPFAIAPIEAFTAHIEVFTWFWDKLINDNLPSSLEFYHIGRCARCGHKLTDEQSIDRGFGPTCYKMIKEQYKNI